MSPNFFIIYETLLFLPTTHYPKSVIRPLIDINLTTDSELSTKHLRGYTQTYSVCWSSTTRPYRHNICCPLTMYT